MAICEHPQGFLAVELPPEPDIRQELDMLINLLEANPCDVIVNFSKVDIMTSMTLSGFLKVREVVTEAKKRLIFTNAAPITKDIFRVTCFDGIFEFIDDNDQAIGALIESAPCQPAGKA